MDEGGPLVCGDKLTGVMSHSVNCGTDNIPSVYTDVAQHSAWIKQIMSGAAKHNSMSYVTTVAMLASLASLWSCRT
jgi:secreted trypsin-like serine protease